MTVAEMFGNI